jgi:hypothetical protein
MKAEAGLDSYPKLSTVNSTSCISDLALEVMKAEVELRKFAEAGISELVTIHF